MRTFIVDDERLARLELRALLRAWPQIEVVGEAESIGEARRAIEELRPQLLFLDVRICEGDGFELLSELTTMPCVVFTTAYDEYAARAFDVHAFDYLVKPIDPARLADTLGRIMEGIAKCDPRSMYLGKLVLKNGRKWFVADIDQVELLESDGNYTRVFWNSQRALILRPLSFFESRLPQDMFVRVSRRHIIALGFVEEMSAVRAGMVEVALRCGRKVAFSRRRLRRFRAASALAGDGS